VGKGGGQQKNKKEKRDRLTKERNPQFNTKKGKRGIMGKGKEKNGN